MPDPEEFERWLRRTLAGSPDLAYPRIISNIPTITPDGVKPEPEQIILSEGLKVEGHRIFGSWDYPDRWKTEAIRPVTIDVPYPENGEWTAPQYDPYSDIKALADKLAETGRPLVGPSLPIIVSAANAEFLEDLQRRIEAGEVIPCRSYLPHDEEEDDESD